MIMYGSGGLEVNCKYNANSFIYLMILKVGDIDKVSVKNEMNV